MKNIHYIIIAMIAAGIFLIVSASRDLTTYSTFKEAMQTDQKVKIVGQLAKDKMMVYNPEKDPNYFEFYLVDDLGIEKKVVYLKEKPQDFELSEKIVLTGKMKDDTFYATDMLLKCPSKYKDEELKLNS